MIGHIAPKYSWTRTRNSHVKETDIKAPFMLVWRHSTYIRQRADTDTVPVGVRHHLLKMNGSFIKLVSYLNFQVVTFLWFCGWRSNRLHTNLAKLFSRRNLTTDRLRIWNYWIYSEEILHPFKTFSSFFSFFWWINFFQCKFCEGYRILSSTFPLQQD
jgi:hypothetical protein